MAASRRFRSKKEQERAIKNFLQNLSDDNESDENESFIESEGGELLKFYF